MSLELPPLNALRAFEAAARHLSFTRAAEEIHVTQAAISHQVRKLEDYLDRKLFRRLHRQLVLTEDGQLFATAVREALQQLAQATERLTSEQAAGYITVSLLPSFASRWLVPRLWRFRDRHPEVEVRLSAFEWLVDFERDGVDLAIRYGKGEWPGCNSRLLMHEKIFPVCSPALLDQVGPFSSPEALAQVNLLHDDYARQDWKQWLKAAGTTGVNARRGLRFSHTSLMLDAAESGQGVALAQAPLVEDDLRRGRLVRLFDIELDGDYSYWVVSPVGAAENPAITAFRDWLLDETETSRTLEYPNEKGPVG
jgi:LysR family transcriptional regulator, glycine cleavage system transcriptional activator